jgi:hypothetical protein
MSYEPPRSDVNTTRAVTREGGIAIESRMRQQRLSIVSPRVGKEKLRIDGTETGEGDFVLRTRTCHYVRSDDEKRGEGETRGYGGFVHV